MVQYTLVSLIRTWRLLSSLLIVANPHNCCTVPANPEFYGVLLHGQPSPTATERLVYPRCGNMPRQSPRCDSPQESLSLPTASPAREPVNQGVVPTGPPVPMGTTEALAMIVARPRYPRRIDDHNSTEPGQN